MHGRRTPLGSSNLDPFLLFLQVQVKVFKGILKCWSDYAEWMHTHTEGVF